MEKKEFTNALLHFVEVAQTLGNVVTSESVEEYFSDLGVEKEKFELVYAYLESAEIHVDGRERKAPEERSPKKKAEAKEKKDNFFRIYLDDLAEVPIYAPDEEEGLILHALEGDKIAPEHLIEGNLKYVVQLVYEMNEEEVALGDLVQEGNIGLMQAASDLNKRAEGESFCGFAKEYITGAINGYIEEQVGSERIKQRLIDKINRLDEAVRMLHEELGREATAAELAAQLDMEEEDVLHLIKISHNAVKAEKH